MTLGLIPLRGTGAPASRQAWGVPRILRRALPKVAHDQSIFYFRPSAMCYTFHGVRA
jgi:hypothetical protein